MNCLVNKLVIVLLTMISMTHSAGTMASVIIPATRIIYPGDLNEKSIQLTNQDDAPSVMQIWVDSGNTESTPETADAPFIVTPPVFRIEPKSGHAVRLVLTDNQLPQDRESVFYLNTLQIPAISSDHADQNQMLVMLRNRLKLFYRPAGLQGSAPAAVESLEFVIRQQQAADGYEVVVRNPSNFHVSLIESEVNCAADKAPFDADMVAPKSESVWPLQGKCTPGAGSQKLTVRYVDDHGAMREMQRDVAVGQGRE
ncbi:MAG: molecular chaperone [Cupriavidus sp.]|nr:molecular chaperone [Cupriavidus sp.]